MKILYNVKAVYIDLYDRLAYSKSDDRLRVIRELIKRDCLTDALEENQIERLAEALSKSRFPDGCRRILKTFWIFGMKQPYGF